MSNIKASTIIAKAKSFVGTKESPANSNNVIFNTDYYGKPVSGSQYPWCAAFIWDIFRMCGASDLYYGGKKCAYCPTLYNYYKEHNQLFSTPKVGDIVFFQFANQNRVGHVGIVVDVLSPTKVTTIEGNTSSTNQSNGGCVEIKTRSSNVIKGYGRPNYEKDSNESTNKDTQISSEYSYEEFVKEVQRILKVSIDGIPGPKTLNATITVSKKCNNKHEIVKPIQKYLKLLGLYNGSIDGVFGNKSDIAIKNYQSWMVRPDGEITAKGTTWKKLLKLI